MINLTAPKSCVTIWFWELKTGICHLKICISLKFSSRNKNFPSYVEICIFLRFMLTSLSRALKALIHSTALFISTLPNQSFSLEDISKSVVWRLVVLSQYKTFFGFVLVVFPNSVLLPWLGESLYWQCILRFLS